MNEFSQKVMAVFFLCGNKKQTIMNPFQSQPAGTPIAPSTSARYYSRRQVFSRNPIEGTSFKPGVTANFNIDASGGHYFVPQESVITARFKVTNHAGGKLSKSVRFATNPVANMFSAAALSIGGTTVESHAANVADVSRLQLRMEQTKAGADGPGGAGLLSFNQKMNHEEASSALLDTAAGGDDINTDGVITALTDGGLVDTKAAIVDVFHTSDERNDKHELLLNNSSGDSVGDAKDLELSCPLSQIFTFCAQNKSFIPNISALIELTINADFRSDMFFSEQLRGVASNGAVQTKVVTTLETIGAATQLDAKVTLPSYIPPVAAVDNTQLPIVTVDSLFIDACFAVPTSVPRPPTSWQIPYQAMTIYTRNLTNTNNFTITMPGIPPSVSAIVMALRSTKHGMHSNRELYQKGTLITKASLSIGQLTLPQPQYDLNFPDRRVGRLMQDFISFTGGSASNGVGADNITEFCKSPLLAFRILQDPGSYASTAIVRLDTSANVGTDCELVFACIHQKVFEAYWQDGESFPSRVVVDDVLN